MNNLTAYGWSQSLALQKEQSSFNHLQHGRITAVHKTNYEVIGESGSLRCELIGNLLYSLQAEAFPCVGDWVLFAPMDQSSGIIYQILRREKQLSRRRVGQSSGLQLIASHIDKAFIVQSLDDNFNIRRVERYLAQLIEENIVPILVLNKCDLPLHIALEEEKKKLPKDLPILVTSTYEHIGMEQLRTNIKAGETVIFIGSSGVGKSSLINSLLGNNQAHTSAISDTTGKGKHTTTRREMFLLETGGVLIDSPGMREFGISSASDETLSEVFDFQSHEEQCRFSDCTHTSEPGCCILQAIEEGRISTDSYHSFLKLRRESERYSKSEHEKRQQMRAFGRLVKEAVTIKNSLK